MSEHEMIDESLQWLMEHANETLILCHRVLPDGRAQYLWRIEGLGGPNTSGELNQKQFEGLLQTGYFGEYFTDTTYRLIGKKLLTRKARQYRMDELRKELERLESEEKKDNA